MNNGDLVWECKIQPCDYDIIKSIIYKVIN